MPNIRDEYGLRDVNVHTPVGLNKIEVNHVVASSEVIGIEVEVENFTARNRDANINRVWDMTNDGSLRNNGVELVSKPFSAMYAPQVLQYLFGVYLADDCCFSPRTSVHIHLNVQDLSRTQVMDLVMIYSVFEKLLYKFAGRGRSKNVYCVPLTECDLLSHLVDFTETRDGAWSKYTGLNTLPVGSYGTVEFRHMHGTTDVGKLCMWISMICKLKEYIKRTSTKQIRSMVAEMTDAFDFGALMHDVFGDAARALQYEGPQELGYLTTKQALASRNHVRHFSENLKSASDFFTFKGN